MTTYRIHFKPSRIEGENGRLFIRVIHRRKYRDILRDYRLARDEWNAAAHEIILPRHDHQTITRLLDIRRALQHDLERIREIDESLRDTGNYSAADICDAFTESERKGDSLMGFTRRLSHELTVQERPRTARAYRSATKSLMAFLGRTDIPLSEVDAGLIRSYERHLFAQGLQMNTVSFYMRNLRAVYYKAVRQRLIIGQALNPFEDVYTGVHQTKRRALDLKDINALARLDIDLTRSVDRPPGSATQAYAENSCGCGYALPLGADRRRQLGDALKYFLFAYHSRGMSFIDLAYLKKSEVKGDRIVYKRKKTGFFMEVKITKPMRKIMAAFKSETKHSEYVFPIIGSGRGNHRLQYESGLNVQNRLLKELASLAGVQKNLSTHVARHTWATVAKRMGYSISLISEGLGHRDPKVTSIYLASFERSVLDEISTRVSKAVIAA